MDAETWHYFREHVKKLEAQMLAGDEDAMRSIACMVLIKESGASPDPDGGVEITTFDGDVVDMSEWLRRRAA